MSSRELVELVSEYPWMSVIIVTRELMVTMLRGFGEAKGQDYSSKFVGKAKLCVQTGVLAGVLLALSHLQGQVWFSYVRDAGLLVAV